MPLYVVLVHQVQGLFSGFLPTQPRSLRSCLRLVVRRVNAHRGLSPPSSRPCWAYEIKESHPAGWLSFISDRYVAGRMGT